MKRTFAVLAVLIGAREASAHDTWLLPDQFRIDAGTSVKLHLTSAMDFPKPETPVKADRLVAAKVRVAGSTRSLDAAAEPGSLALTARLGEPGLAVAWIETRARAIELAPKEVAEYLEEIGAADTIARAWKESGKGVWRETYAKRAKTFVRVGPADTGDVSWREPVGLDLELVPESDPTALSVGDSLSIRLLWQGKPLPLLAVGAVTAAPAKPVLATTDSEGRVSFLLGRPGPWLVRATLIRPSDSRPGEWDSVFTTLTFEVNPR